LTFRLLAIVIAGALAAPAAAADGVIGTWMSGAGPSAKTYVFKTYDNTFIGTVCGPCDDPSTVFRVAEGTVTMPPTSRFSSSAATARRRRQSR